MRSVRLGTLAAAAAVFIAGCDSARPLEQRAEAGVCERCHGFPPRVPHPQLASCSACHGTTVSEGTVIIAGGTHQNGRIDVTAHPVPYEQHPREALRRPDQPLGQPLLSGCRLCHGTDFAGGITGTSCNACHAAQVGFADWQTNCTFCHGTRTPGTTTAIPAAAPPQTVAGDEDPGVHQPHLAGALSSGVACRECHPDRVDLDHADGNVVMAFGTLATTNGATATFDPQTKSCANYCHGATLPEPEGGRAVFTWAPPSPVLTCNSCHQGNPTTGRHPAVSNGHGAFPCGACHGGAYTATTVERPLHVNGAIEKNAFTGWNDTTQGCTAVCHSQSERSWR